MTRLRFDAQYQVYLVIIIIRLKVPPYYFASFIFPIRSRSHNTVIIGISEVPRFDM